MKVIPRTNNRPGKDGQTFPIAWVNGSICFFSCNVPVEKEIEVMITGRSKTQIKLPDGSLQPATLFVAPVTDKYVLRTVPGFESDYIRLKDPKPGEPTHKEYASAFLSSDKKHKIMSGRVPVYRVHSNMGTKPDSDLLHSCQIWVELVPGKNGLSRAVGLENPADIDHIVMIKRGEAEPVIRDNNDERAKRSLKATNSSNNDYLSRSAKTMENAFKSAGKPIKEPAY